MTNVASFKKIGSSGPELLLLHGWQHSIENLWELGKCLSKTYQVYLLELPGFAGLALPSKDWSTADYVQYIREFIEENKIKPVLIGHSFGGRLAVKLAALYPDLLADNLILIGTPGVPSAQNPLKKLRLFLLKYSAKLLKLCDRIFKSSFFENKFVPRFASADYKQSGELKALLVRTLKENLTDFASRIDKRTLLLWGQFDRQAPLDQARAYRDLIRKSELKILPYHGHEPFGDVGAHYCSKIISRFLNAGS